jgi:type IV pilus assembly protein PilY1
LDDAGQYFSRQDNRGPWGATPGTDDPSPQLECRQNYTILMTDGYWCGAAASTSEARGQVDRDDGPVISSPDGATYQYQGGPPYEDAYSNTLADVAMYYWYRDLRTDLPNAVPTNAQDEAFWQHMVTFGVSLGVTGTLEETDWDDLESGDQAWPNPDTGSTSCSVETRLDDLWHAGVNGRGGFFSAAEPDAFAEGLSDSLSNIADRIGSAASVASNSTRLEADSLIYQARFNSTDWSGDLLSFTVNPATGAVVSQDWSAADKLDASVATRNILTYDGGSGGSAGATFVWSNLTDAQKTALGGSVRGQAVVDFLRGDRSCEREQVVGSCGYDLDGDGTTGDSGDQAFRARGSRLGDIVSSDPAYSGDEDFGFSVFDSSYTSYVASKASRTPAVFVGANDGMLHAFDARASASNGGEELFAYVPSSLIPDLADLADPAYTHRYYVDGSPVVIDAKIGTGSTAWRTVVLGSTGAGGRTVFALDITRDDLTTTDDGDVLWELTDNRLGVAVPRPAIARFESDTWVALIPNGYNSLNDRAALLVVDLSDGTVLAELDTGVGDNATPNGLGPVVAIDVDTDGEVDYAYAGDMLGNLWRFEFSGSSSSDWSVTDYSVDSGIQPLFTACSAATCTSTNRQPITARPSVTRHPDGGLMVLFGTGSYFQDGDNAPAAATQIQSFYGLRDLATATAISGRSALQEQTILSEGLVPGSSSVGYRVTSNTAVSYGSLRGWYMDLAYDTDEDGGIDASEILGERVVNPAIVRDERVIFSTLIPDTAACSFGGDSWLMVLDAINGARLDFAPLDVTNDGTIDQSDLLALDLDGDGTDEYYEPSGKGYSDKIVEFSEQGFLDDGGSVTEKAYGSSSTGEIEDETFGRRAGFFGRQSWFQVSPPVDD